MGINEYNKKPQGFVKTFPVNTFGYGEVIGAGDANTIQTGQVLTVNGKSCTFERLSGEISRIPMKLQGVIRENILTLSNFLPPQQSANSNFSGNISATSGHIYSLQLYSYKNGSWTMIHNEPFGGGNNHDFNFAVDTTDCSLGFYWYVDYNDNIYYFANTYYENLSDAQNDYILFASAPDQPSKNPMTCGDIINASIQEGSWVEIGQAGLKFVNSYVYNPLGNLYNTNQYEDIGSYSSSIMLENDHVAEATQRKIFVQTENGDVSVFFIENPGGIEYYFYIANDGSTYYAKSDHTGGLPDINFRQAVEGGHLARAAEGGSSVMTWNIVKTQLDASEIGTCGLFTITRRGIAGEVDIKINDDYTDCIVERDDTGLFTDNHEIYNGKKRGAKITIPNHWNTNNVPKFTIMNSSNNVDWRPCNNIFSYHPITGVFSFLALNNQTIEGEIVKNILFKVYAEQLGEIADE
ncbi:MAG: hypothetical protein QXS18_06580 [Thermoplasmata archaeon]